jgi:hypothetical protein
MTTPILLIHGYGAESAQTDATSITGIYGQLPARLRAAYGNAAVFDLDVSRYLTLNDGVTIDDLSFALDRALNADFKNLLDGGFNVAIHSTGALVIRNWLRNFGDNYPNKPLRRLLYLAGALFGSGWAHIGKGQLAKWARFVFQDGAERGVHVLDALELGSSWTIDLHQHFLQPGFGLVEHYGVREAAVIGTQPSFEWFIVPIRYAHEDGSDGVVRVPAGNPNFNYVRVVSNEAGRTIAWADLQTAVAAHESGAVTDPKATYYEIASPDSVAASDRPAAPFAVAYGRAHTGSTGIVQQVTDQVFNLVRAAFDTPDENWSTVAGLFAAQTAATYTQAAAANTAPLPIKWVTDSRSLYDRHAQVIFRVRDQDGRPVEHFDIFFNNVAVASANALPIGDLFEDEHVNDVTANCICFYLRATKWDGTTWVDRVAQVGEFVLEVTAVEPSTDSIRYVPLSLSVEPSELAQWIAPHTTTIVDVELLRIPGPDVFMIAKATP